MNTGTTTTFCENIVWAPQQVGSVDNLPVFAFPGVSMPYIEDVFSKKTAQKEEIEEFVGPGDVRILEFSKRYFEENKASLLTKYKGKYVAILNNRVIGSHKDFSKLAQRVYKKHGYQTVYMPFVEVKKKIFKIPSPIIKIS